jgi:phage major head subunit gpT-like protein
MQIFKTVIFGAVLAALALIGPLVASAQPIHDYVAAVANAGGLGAIGAFAGLTVNRQNLADMFRGFQTIFQRAFEGAPSQWGQVAMRVPSTASEEKYGWLGATTRFREWLGDRVVQNLSTYDYTIKNKSYENTVGVEREDIEDDRLGVYSPMIQQLGLDAKQHPDELVFALLAAGFTNLGYDGQFFFDTDHPVYGVDGAVTSVANMTAGAGNPWFLIDDTRALKPLIYQDRKPYNFVAMDREDDEGVFTRKLFRYGVDCRCNVGFGLWQLAWGSKAVLDAANYGAARTGLMGMKGDNGKPLGIRPTLLVCGPSNEKAALDVLQAERQANGATNVYRNTAKLVVTPWLA